MTEVNGLRLAFRGLVAGLAAGYVWLAVSMVVAAPFGDPLSPHRQLASAVLPLDTTRGGSLLFGLSAAQVAGGAFGMLFAYFVGRFFTVRPTLALAAPALALLAWLAASASADPELAAQVPMLVAVLVYGAALGQQLPLRADVLRARPAAPSWPQAPGSPST
ncbi:MAG TPA: hypothetical protein VFH63_00785 [candidate division Zixibacteria bacterium]|nr:hypothetical protein [candidate division Zixibacteria bacterium]